MRLLHRTPKDQIDQLQNGPRLLPRIAGFSWRLINLTVMTAALVALVAVIVLVSVPRIMGWTGVIVLSGSMEPALKTGGIAFVEPVKPSNITTGDIMTFKVPSGRGVITATHRVIEVTRVDGQLVFRTKGDANRDPDPNYVNASDVLGTVRHDLPYVGNVVDKMRNRENFYLVIGIPAVLLIFSELWNIGGDLRQAGRSKDAVSSIENVSTGEGVPS